MNDLIEKTRSRSHEEKWVFHRMVLSKILRDAGFSLKDIGRMLCRERSTINNSLQVYNRLKSYNDRKLENIESLYNGKEEQVISDYSKFLEPLDEEIS